MFSFPFLRKRGPSGSSSEDRRARLRRVLDKLNPHNSAVELEAMDPSWPPERTSFARHQLLRFPLSSPQRIAVLRGGFSLPGNAREFPAADLEAIRGYGPDALVAPLNIALVLAGEKLSGKFDLPSLQTAIAIVTRIDDSPLAEHHRDLLWRAFEVPIFEMLVSWDGSVIARECECHGGLHVDPDIVIATVRDEELLLTHLNDTGEPIVLARTGYAAEMVTDHCDCGLNSVRLQNFVSIRQQVPIA